ncbi:MAG TPA: aminotransferase class III-fold pyridoxal phosphate-dependent enzyme [Chitinophagaceae bacterium]|nr:aminotransferase class III-fold pyridoxal phosphate-dependent enzyme [Chitinophagaceae bacterium]HNA91588.1 aminotransferase class III-fold pyridoxal phosphate-dependent enzyme [Chitinophagaceae bacterium]HNA96288.1 aminotransferase class III-fold pyridoxal phosphate-dependent enzyme [Chitinophagaceae bacterium]HNC38849.1 aminotransferase class III-fold pyridoxal phosphate-dependent enzyme [Chitinophagaceae bacterium]HND94734.1 aminotransferase class III-fold pyridoxal phosphate-dependent en
MNTKTQSEAAEIIKDNLDYTLFSWSKQKGIAPIAVKYAEGVYLYDYDDKRYLDFSSGLMNVNIGHGNQRVTEAVVKQMQEAAYVTPSCVTKVRGELGKKLASICPGDLNKAFFTLCGATSIENAIKLARLYTGRHKILTRYQSYHGASYGAMSASGDPRRLPMDTQQAPNFVHFDLPYLYRWEYGEENLLKETVASLEKIVAYEGPNNIAAILLEGESGSSGCFKYPVGYLKAVREICNRHGILLIIDEVMSGFGRTGKWFGFQNHDIIPDMIAMAKGLTCGYLPFGCLMVSDKIAAKFDDTVLSLGLTYSAHPVSCAAALETLKIYEDDHLIENCVAMSKYLEQQVEKLKAKHPSIGDFRNTGLLGCIELVKNKKTKEPMAPFNAKPDEMTVMNKVAAKIKELGMYTFVRWGFIFIAPPLCITKEQIDEGLAIISEAIAIADKEYAE